MARVLKEAMKAKGEHKSDEWDQDLEILNLQPADDDKLGREVVGGHAARVAAECEKSDILEGDAESNRRHQPRVRPASHKWAHGDAFDEDAPECAGNERDGNCCHERPTHRYR